MCVQGQPIRLSIERSHIVQRFVAVCELQVCTHQYIEWLNGSGQNTTLFGFGLFSYLKWKLIRTFVQRKQNTPPNRLVAMSTTHPSSMHFYVRRTLVSPDGLELRFLCMIMVRMLHWISMFLIMAPLLVPPCVVLGNSVSIHYFTLSANESRSDNQSKLK